MPRVTAEPADEHAPLEWIEPLEQRLRGPALLPLPEQQPRVGQIEAGKPQPPQPVFDLALDPGVEDRGAGRG